jgi:hypothetical protein
MDATRNGRHVNPDRGRLRRLFVRAAVLAWLLTLSACREVLGLGDYGVQQDASSAKGHRAAFRFADTPCGGCLTSDCTPELDTCNEDVLCAGWERCMAACMPGDGACEHDCFQVAGATNRKMGDLSMCEFSHCYDECKASGATSAFSPTCANSIAQGCDSQARACAGDPSCREFFACMFEKNCIIGDGALEPPDGAVGSSTGPVGWNPGCSRPCFDRAGQYVPRSVADGGLATNALGAIGLCTYVQAQAACGLDSLSCTSRYTRPPPAAAANAVAVDLWAYTSQFPEFVGTPIQRAPVSACRLQYADCYPIPGYTTQGTTDDNGHASFRLPTNGLGLPWYFELTPSWPNGPAHLLLVPARNLAEDTALVLPADPAGNVMQLQLSEDLVGGYGAVYIWFKGCADFPIPGLEARVDGERRAGAVTYYDALHTEPTAASILALMGGVEPGLRVISAWKDVPGRGKMMVSMTTVMVKANSVTYVPWFEPM